MLAHWQQLEQQATLEHWSYPQYLLALCELEAQRRYTLKVQRAMSEAQLPTGKSLTNFVFDHCPTLNPATVTHLANDKSWVEQGSNILVFGPSGTGKTHVATGLAQAQIELGHRVKFTSATALVQALQLAKLNLQLPAALTKLDRYDLLVVDDLGYVKKSEAETSVLFELIADRYERKSLLVTANQPFSAWDEIFTDSMMTVAAIDRLIHHAVVLEMHGESFRQQQTKERLLPNPKTASKEGVKTAP
jgi:DNA replication protein DnaC